MSIGSSVAVFLSGLVGGNTPQPTAITNARSLTSATNYVALNIALYLKDKISISCNGNKKNHAKPGSYPKKETGNLVKSIDAKRIKDTSYIVGYKKKGEYCNKYTDERSTKYANILNKRGYLGPVDAAQEIKDDLEKFFNVKISLTRTSKRPG